MKNKKGRKTKRKRWTSSSLDLSIERMLERMAAYRLGARLPKKKKAFKGKRYT